MRLTVSPRLHTLVLHGTRHLLLLMCVGAVVVAFWASRSMTRLDRLSGHPAFNPVDHGVVEGVREAEDLQELKKACIQLAARAELADAAERRDNAMALTMTNNFYSAARGFSAMCAVVLLVAWVAAGGVLRSVRATPLAQSSDAP
jgi:hypothetical protein